MSLLTVLYQALRNKLNTQLDITQILLYPTMSRDGNMFFFLAVTVAWLIFTRVPQSPAGWVRSAGRWWKIKTDHTPGNIPKYTSKQ